MNEPKIEQYWFTPGESDPQQWADETWCTWSQVETALRARDAELEKAREECDLAIAHDRQPYPTAEAYERVCATLHTREAELEELVKALREVRRVTSNEDVREDEIDMAMAQADALLSRYPETEEASHD